MDNSSMSKNGILTLEEHLQEVKAGTRRFENAFQAVSRMILEEPDSIKKVSVCGEPTYDFPIFRQGPKHIIGMYSEINSFVSFVKDAAEGGSSKEMAFVLVGEPGNGKTFFVDYLCSMYRNFISKPGNRKFTFRLKGVDQLGSYGKIPFVESQTFEDPMILAMNLLETQDENKDLLSKLCFSDAEIEKLFANYRPLGACSSFILNDLKQKHGEDLGELMKAVEVVPVPLSENLGILTGKYSAKDKITSSSVDLLGEESMQRLLNIADSSNPFRFDIRRGALARVGGGGIHFVDEIFKNKKDLIQVYLAVIQNRMIEIDGFRWPIDTLIVATSNNDEFNEFRSQARESPIVDRCRICYMSHNTDYNLQGALTAYAIGSEQKTALNMECLHQDPNLNYAASIGVVLSRLPKTDKLTPIEMMKLAAGEIAGDKSIKALAEVIDTLNHEPDVTKRFGQKGVGQRNLGRAIQILLESSATNEGRCMYAGDIFPALERIVLDNVADSNERIKYIKDIEIAKGLYRERIMTEMFNAYMDEPGAIKKDVLNYVNMIVGIDAEDLGPNRIWRYRDPQTGDIKALKIDENYVKNVENRLGLKTKEQADSFRTTIRRIYGQKTAVEPGYDYMDNLPLVKAVTEVRLKSDVAGAGSLVGALANRTNDENQMLYNRMVGTMMNKLGYCKTCAEKTIEFFCTYDSTT